MTDPNNFKSPVPAPASLVENGKINFGTFVTPPRAINLDKAKMPGFPGSAPQAIKDGRLKQWQFYMFVNSDYAIGFAILDYRFIKNSFFYVYDRKAGKAARYKQIRVDNCVTITDSIWDGRCSISVKGYSISVKNMLAAGKGHEITFDIAATKDAPAVSGTVTMLEDPVKSNPLVVSLPIGQSHSMYSHKVPAPATGQLRFGGKTITFDPATDTAFLDEHKAYYPHHTYWRWMSMCFIAEDGSLNGANMTRNLISDPERWNENAIWSKNGISLLSPANFEFDEKDVMKPWRITDSRGQLELTFKPLGVKSQITGVKPVFNVIYHQPFGLFNGTLVDNYGNTVKVRDVYGVTEYHDTYF